MRVLAIILASVLSLTPVHAATGPQETSIPPELLVQSVGADAGAVVAVCMNGRPPETVPALPASTRTAPPSTAVLMSGVPA